MTHVTTPYFTFHDGDDWVDSGYTAYFVRAFDEHPDVDIVSCGFGLILKSAMKVILSEVSKVVA